MARKLERSRYRMLYLIGVDHSVQHDGCAGYEGSTFERLRNEFPTFLDGVARRIGATVIAEELNEDVLNKFGATKSVADTVASQMNIKHVFCEPSISEREQLGMKGTNNPDDFSRREDFWLNKLVTLKGERILFILGADHVESFSERAKNAGFLVNVSEEYYGKEYFPPLNVASS